MSVKLVIWAIGLSFVIQPVHAARRARCGAPMERMAFEALRKGAAKNARNTRLLELKLEEIANTQPFDDARFEKLLREEIADGPSVTMLKKLIVAFIRTKTVGASKHWTTAKIQELEEKLLAAYEKLVPRSTELDGKYGKLYLPAMLKDWEKSDDGIVRNPTTQVLDPNLKDQKVGKLDEAKEYSWIVDARGRLVIGEEYVLRENESLGHPTLLNGQFGRIAGDLKFEGGEWKITQKSARYSMMKGRKKPHLENVGKLFEAFGRPVKVNFLDYLDF